MNVNYRQQCRCMTVNDVAINMNTSNGLHSIFPCDLNGVDVLFGKMLYLMSH